MQTNLYFYNLFTISEQNPVQLALREFYISFENGNNFSIDLHKKNVNSLSLFVHFFCWFRSDVPYADLYRVYRMYTQMHVTMRDVVRERHIDVRQTFCCAISYWLVSKRSQWSRVSFRKQLSTPLVREIGSVLSSLVVVLNKVSRLDREAVFIPYVYEMSILT